MSVAKLTEKDSLELYPIIDTDDWPRSGRLSRAGSVTTFSRIRTTRFHT
jgi:hypothetical protein